MNWKLFRFIPWIDARANFVMGTPKGGTLLDIGSAEGETLGHIAELRPDLRLFAADIAGQPEKYPAGCQFHRSNVEIEKFPWNDASVDTITCIHLVEHLHELNLLMAEVARLLKPGGRIYFETPHPKSLHLPKGQGFGVPLNFYDDTGHVRIVSAEELAKLAASAGLRVERIGLSRNWLFAAAHLLFAWLPPSRKKFTAYLNWIGWSACVIARHP